MSFEIILHGVKCAPVTAPTPEQIKMQTTSLLEWFCQSPFYEKSDYMGFLNALPLHTIGGFGMNTMCVEAISENKSIIVNAGTGIRSAHTLKNSNASDFHIIFTSTNLNFFLGLALFTPFYNSTSKIYIYSAIKNFKEHFINNFNKVTQLAKFEELPGQINFIQLDTASPASIEGFNIGSYLLNNNESEFGLIIKKNGVTFSHIIRGHSLNSNDFNTRTASELYQNIDVMLHDGRGVLDQNTHLDTDIPAPLKAAVNNKVKKILFAQADPVADDDEISNRFLIIFDKLIAFLNSEKANKVSLDCSVAGEGSSIILK